MRSGNNALSGGTVYIQDDSNGCKVQIGSGTATDKLHVFGNATISGILTTSTIA